ncbi:flagellar basal-body MS-ring/collar protein FliF [Aurantiacibacter luteus]|uniref:Flagellar M-ring protein n=1 Tax=Aurantiacibacter luteus TaxID=1581420 RepID=A0A0G9MKQ2_9SPHN|nr:flagellar basal-body MS-ring/collar protein FliF [Aurantiacibacter luteus]KLE31262.1 hypothetical protein AAW00_13955 [Aurantiacibacter luteus]
MADLIPATAGAADPRAVPPSLLAPLTDPAGGTLRDRFGGFFGQPAVRRALPGIVGVSALAGAALLWVSLSSGPQRVLYSTLSDAERSEVVGALEQGGITYAIDASTGTLTVGEDDLYKARMLVASNGALAAPDSTAELLDSIPLGSSRTLEGERLRNVRERELMLTIAEIDGVEAVRVHLATPERTVFVRERTAPSASVMVRLARGRSLSPDQVMAIGNLVAASVPGMTADAVRVVDQHGQLLSSTGGENADGLDLQRQFEDKLRAQLAQLLTPIVGEGNFSTEVQVELDLAEVTSAQESYDREGAIRSETQSRSQSQGPGLAGGVPGVLSNTPPPPTGLDDAAPEGTVTEAGALATSGESTARRTYELGRQVAVSSTTPGAVKRLSVAVAVDSAALGTIAPANLQSIENLVGSAVGAQPDRGDRVTVITSAFSPTDIEDAPFWETAWFATILRNAVALIAVILAAVFGLRPLMAMLRRRGETADERVRMLASPVSGEQDTDALLDATSMHEQIELTRKLAADKPERAAAALRRMLAPPAESRAA